MDILQVFAIGVGLAGAYSLIAVGFALIFATLRIFHLAHGTMFISAGYLFFFLHRVHGWHLLAAALVAIAAAAILGLAVDRLVYQPIMRRGGGMFSVFIASLGVALVVEAGFLAYTKGVLSVARSDSLAIFGLGPVAVRGLDLGVLAIAVAVFGLLYQWLHRTQVGLEVRGLTDNSALSAVVGVDVARTRKHIFLLASALAGLAGVVTAYDMGISPETSMRTLFVAIVAVMLGGTRNILAGTAVGSLILGILTAFASFYFPQWVTFSVFLAMILLILVRPQGLFR